MPLRFTVDYFFIDMSLMCGESIMCEIIKCNWSNLISCESDNAIRILGLHFAESLQDGWVRRSSASQSARRSFSNRLANLQHSRSSEQHKQCPLQQLLHLHELRVSRSFNVVFVIAKNHIFRSGTERCAFTAEGQQTNDTDKGKAPAPAFGVQKTAVGELPQRHPSHSLD